MQQALQKKSAFRAPSVVVTRLDSRYRPRLDPRSSVRRIFHRFHRCSCKANGSESDTGTSENGVSQELSRSASSAMAPQMEAVQEEEEVNSAEDDNIVSAEDARDAESSTALQPFRWRDLVDRNFGRIAYSYFSWRKGTWNDLQLLLWLNLAIVVAGGLVKTVFVDTVSGQGPETAHSRFWQNVYQVVTVVFGQEFPDEASGAAVQLFSLAVGAVGLAAFALVIALTEQLVLEVLEDRVKKGSAVYEKGHVLVLGWASNRRDEEVMWKILSQVCLAFRNDGGTCVVVLSHRPKLTMESQFKDIIPESQRFGTRFVFRQGSPALPSDLRKVAASSAAATIVVSDSTRSPEEADAQSLRVAVLIDELDFPGFGVPDTRTGHIIVELKQDGTDEMLGYVCSKRVVPLMSNRMNAVRLARLVRRPVVGAVSQMLWSFNSSSQGYLQPVPQLEGRAYGPLYRFFNDGIILGVLNPVTQECEINPPAARRIQAHDQLIMMRPTSISSWKYGPSRTPEHVTLGSGWDPHAYLRGSVDQEAVTVGPSNMDELQDMVEGLSDSMLGTGAAPRGSRARDKLSNNTVNVSKQCAQLYMLPQEYVSNLVDDEPEKVLIAGFGQFTFMVELLRALDNELTQGSTITLFSERTTKETVGRLKEDAALKRISMLQVEGNPCRRRDLRKLDITKYRCAIILCDQAWMDPDGDDSNGIDERSQHAMLRLDALVMRVQLNVRFLLEEAGQPDINIITEKVAFEGVTRFEDRSRLPLGTMVNFTAHAARMLTQAAYNPLVLLPLAQFGRTSEVLVQDAAALAQQGEELSFWQLQARSATIHQVLMGYITIPSTVDQPLDLVINPQGNEARSKVRVWNQGDLRTKFISLALSDTSNATNSNAERSVPEMEVAHVPRQAVAA
ncbi:hypothetical protein WJX73_008207 [Symbiochloris irregularis]|uniref:Uncharacterized protein n=1 Tax=Symbiochloris irregularis TaxID=706552 RepID=A0AAW1NXA2_9CHLO